MQFGKLNPLERHGEKHRDASSGAGVKPSGHVSTSQHGSRHPTGDGEPSVGHSSIQPNDPILPSVGQNTPHPIGRGPEGGQRGRHFSGFKGTVPLPNGHFFGLGVGFTSSTGDGDGAGTICRTGDSDG